MAKPEKLTLERELELRAVADIVPKHWGYPILLGEIDALRAALRHARDLLGWQCPPGHEDELEALDAELAALGLK
jgi:hypothetical protein